MHGVQGNAPTLEPAVSLPLEDAQRIFALGRYLVLHKSCLVVEPVELGRGEFGFEHPDPRPGLVRGQGLPSVGSVRLGLEPGLGGVGAPQCEEGESEMLSPAVVPAAAAVVVPAVAVMISRAETCLIGLYFGAHSPHFEFFDQFRRWAALMLQERRHEMSRRDALGSHDVCATEVSELLFFQDGPANALYFQGVAMVLCVVKHVGVLRASGGGEVESASSGSGLAALV